jgi:hypothetical protein
MVTTWKIINYEHGKLNLCNNTISLKIHNKEATNQNKIANIFNSYFLSTADALNSGNNKHTKIKEPNPLSYLINSFHRPFPKMKWHYTSTYCIVFIMRTPSNENPSAWNFLSPELEVTWRTVAIIIWVVLLSPYLRIRDLSPSSIHYNQSQRVCINRRQQCICLIWNENIN